MNSGVQINATVAVRDVTLELNMPAGSITAIVGPNGAGKSTLVGLVSGELQPDEGTVQIAGHIISGPDKHLPPHRRRIALLDQRPLLFPHLSVLDNVAFGLRARGVPKAAALQRAHEELEAVGAAHFARRHPTALSGGEAQRVALARALATDPLVLALDEPFASLDVGTATAMRRLLTSRLRGSATTVLLVTHDPLDVWALASHVISIEKGRVVAQGDVEELLGRPATGFLAQLAGLNLLRGTATESGLVAENVSVAGLWDGGEPAPAGERALATFSPSAVALYKHAPEGSPRNVWPSTVVGLDPRGDIVRVRLSLADGQSIAADITAQALSRLDIQSGDAVVSQVKAAQITLFTVC